MRIAEAVAASMAGLKEEQRDSVAAALDVAPTTIYAWGQGTLSPRADQVAPFCKATGRDLLMQAIIEEVELAKRGHQPELTGTVTEFDLFKECQDILAALVAALTDKVLVAKEVRAIYRECNEFVWTLGAYVAAQVRGKASKAVTRCATLADTARAGR